MPVFDPTVDTFYRLVRTHFGTCEPELKWASLRERSRFAFTAILMVGQEVHDGGELRAVPGHVMPMTI